MRRRPVPQTREQVKTVLGAGCDELQGFYFSRAGWRGLGPMLVTFPWRERQNPIHSVERSRDARSFKWVFLQSPASSLAIPLFPAFPNSLRHPQHSC